MSGSQIIASIGKNWRFPIGTEFRRELSVAYLFKTVFIDIYVWFETVHCLLLHRFSHLFHRADVHSFRIGFRYIFNKQIQTRQEGWECHDCLERIVSSM